MNGTVQTEQRPARQTRPEREYVSPEVNIYETKDGYVLEAEMPGVSKEGLEITLEGSEITIAGHRQNEVVAGAPLFRERALVDYRRVFELDPAIDTAKIVAKMNQGVLTLTLPKSVKVQPCKIAIN
jgi:HSP20 family protein